MQGLRFKVQGSRFKVQKEDASCGLCHPEQREGSVNVSKEKNAQVDAIRFFALLNNSSSSLRGIRMTKNGKGRQKNDRDSMRKF